MRVAVLSFAAATVFFALALLGVVRAGSGAPTPHAIRLGWSTATGARAGGARRVSEIKFKVESASVSSYRRQKGGRGR